MLFDTWLCFCCHWEELAAGASVCTELRLESLKFLLLCDFMLQVFITYFWRLFPSRIVLYKAVLLVTSALIYA